MIPVCEVRCWVSGLRLEEFGGRTGAWALGSWLGRLEAESASGGGEEV